MYYTIVCREPFIYLYRDKPEILQSDYEYIKDNPEECDLRFVTGHEGEFKFEEEFKCYSPAEFSRELDLTIGEGLVYTFCDGDMVRRMYRKAPYFYVYPENAISYSTYCNSANSIKSGLLQNEELLPVIEELTRNYIVPEELELTSEVPYDGEDVVAYVCIPVKMSLIPIGTETEEEHIEVQEDSEF